MMAMIRQVPISTVVTVPRTEFKKVKSFTPTNVCVASPKGSEHEITLKVACLLHFKICFFTHGLI